MNSEKHAKQNRKEIPTPTNIVKDKHIDEREKKRKKAINESGGVRKKNKQNVKNIEDNSTNIIEQCFQRRIMNADFSSCWLNSCLQLLLIAFDTKLPTESFNSNLGIQLQKLHSTDVSLPLDPVSIRQLITDTEEARIQAEKDELVHLIKDPRELRRMLRIKNNSKLNLGTGQQCVRDFFVCIRENRESWIDVYSFLNYNVKDTTKCSNCGNISSNETREEIYTEVNCPTDGSNLSTCIEEYFNKGESVESTCELCHTKGLGEKRTLMVDVETTKFFIIIIRRTEMDYRGRAAINTNDVTCIGNVKLCDFRNCEAIFEPICAVQHQGVLREDGVSYGHYTADVKEQRSSKWYRTSDNALPVPLSPSDVTKRGYVFLYKNVSFGLPSSRC